MPEPVAPSALLADIQARRRRSSANSAKVQNDEQQKVASENITSAAAAAAAAPPPPPSPAKTSSSQQSIESSVVNPSPSATLTAADMNESAALRRRLSKTESEKKALIRKLSVVERLQDSERQKIESDASTKVDTLREENATLLNEIEKITAEKTLLAQRCEKAEKDLAETTLIMETFESKLQTANTLNAQLQQELDDARKAIRACDASKGALNNGSDASAAATDLKAMEEDFNMKLKLLEEELSIARRAVATSEAKFSIAEDSTDKLNAEVMRSRGESIIVANKLRDVMEALEGVKLELEDEREQSEDLRKKLKVCEDSLEAERSKTIKGVGSSTTTTTMSIPSKDDHEEFVDDDDSSDDEVGAGNGRSSRKVSIIEDFIRPVIDEDNSVMSNDKPLENNTKVEGEKRGQMEKKKKTTRRQSLLDGMMASSAKSSETPTIAEDEDEDDDEDEDEGEINDNSRASYTDNTSKAAVMESFELQNERSQNPLKEQLTQAEAEVSQLKSIIHERDLDIHRLETTISALQPIQVEINSLKIIIESVGTPLEDDVQDSTTFVNQGGADAHNIQAIKEEERAPIPPILATPPRLSPSLKRRVSMSALSSSSSLSSPLSSPSSLKGVKRSGKQTIQDIDDSEGVIFMSMLRCGWLLSDIHDDEALHALVKRASIMHFEPGQKIIERGFVGGGLLAVSNGKICLQDVDGSVVAVARIGGIGALSSSLIA